MGRRGGHAEDEVGGVVGGRFEVVFGFAVGDGVFAVMELDKLVLVAGSSWMRSWED